MKIGSTSEFCPALRSFRRRAHLHGEAIAVALHHGLHPGFLALFAGQHKRGRQRYLCMTEGRVGTFDGTCPQPGNDREFLPLIGRKVRPLRHHFRRDFHLRVQVADALLGFGPHPRAIAPNVLGQPGGPRPLQSLCLRARRGRADGGATRELGRNFDHGLVDGHGHRIQIRSPGFQPQALRFQRNAAASGKGIVKGRKLVRVEQFRRLWMVFIESAGFAP